MTRPTTRLITTALLALTVLAGQAPAQPDLTRGEDFIETPAIGGGLCVSNLFQSNMVLQRDKPIVVWGWATPGETVTVGLAGNEATATAANDRSWKVTLPALPANAKPQTITVKGKNQTLTLDNILIGDVWVLGGQSNMEFPLSRIENGWLEIHAANFPQIRIMTVPQLVGPERHQSFPRMYQWSGWFSRHYRQGYWDLCTPENVTELSAIGYVFARRIHMTTQVPIGVIDTSIGGTTVEAWTPDAAMRKLEHESVKTMLADWDTKVAEFDPQEDLKTRIERYNARTERLKNEGKDVSGRTPPTDLQPGPAMNKNRPGNCYNGLIGPLTGLPVKGAIWHQGYNNCFNGTEGAVMYQHVFPEMISAWREAFGDPEMAFGILTLCTQGKKQEREDFTSQMSDTGPFIREAQYKTFLKFIEAGDKHVGFASTYDLGRRWYHPQLKVPAGERLARWALASEYGVTRGMDWEQALLQEAKADNGSMVLKFDRRVSAEDNGLPMEGFAIAGKDRKFHPADAQYLIVGKDDRGRNKYDNTTVVLTSPMVPEPVAFRYAWARMPMGNVRVGSGTSDVPLATQRSDDWPLEQTPLIDFGEEYTGGKLDRRQNGKLRAALRQIDLDRRIAEAKALLKEHDQSAD